MLALSPLGRVHLEAPLEGGEPPLDAEVRERVERAFALGPGPGLLHLGAVEVETALPPSYAFFRELARLYLTRLRGIPELEEARERASVAAPEDELAKLAEAVPPMPGAEYATSEVLRAPWQEIEAAFRADIRGHAGKVEAYLAGKNPVWNLVGRVCFHLAENKADPECPFAFVATYSTRVSAGKAGIKHLQLAQALKEFAGDKAALLSLLVPVQRAAKDSALVKELVDSGEVFEALAWTPAEAHRLLKELPVLEAAGVVVRVPDWWKKKSRVQVTVTVGGKQPAGLGLDALLGFSVGVALGGEALDEAEWRALLAGTDQLAFVRGRWVELDKERLAEVLAHWKTAQKAAKQGVSFAEGMRLLSGLELGGKPALDRHGPPADAAFVDGDREWARIEAGEWLSGVLERLRSPDGAGAALPELRAELRPYQAVGVRWLEWISELGLGACLADDMGLGKTVQVLALLLSLKKRQTRRPHLLVVPASLISNWESELARFAPTLRALVAHASAIPSKELAVLPAERWSGVDLVITTYGSASRVEWIAKAEWDLVILDEAQAIKNPGARQTRAVKALRARARIALTGTPIENRLGDLWSLFDFLNPGLLGSTKSFGQLAKKLSSYAPLRRLVGPYILRRKKNDPRVISDLPDKTEVRAFCPLSKPQAALYEQSVRELEASLRGADGIKRRGMILAFLMRFKQICNHPAQWLRDGDWAEARSGKLGRVREICEAIAQKQEKVLVFTQFRETTAPLAAFLEQVFGKPGLVLHGDTPIKQRKALVEQFQGDDGPPFFVLSLKAGGTGLNLTAAAHVIHFDRWWNPAVEDQATDRAYRIGQKKNVLVHKLVCRGTVEEKIDALIESKQSLSRELLEGGGEVLLTELDDRDLMNLVSLDIHRALEEA